MIRALTVAAVLIVLASPVMADCQFKHCQDNMFKQKPRTYDITNNSRQKVGDIYDPGHNRRLQIRNNSRQIIGYIERDGDVTNTSRQRVLSIESLGLGVD